MISCISVHRPHFMWQVLTWFIWRKNQYNTSYHTLPHTSPPVIFSPVFFFLSFISPHHYLSFSSPPSLFWFFTFSSLFYSILLSLSYILSLLTFLLFSFHLYQYESLPLFSLRFFFFLVSYACVDVSLPFCQSLCLLISHPSTKMKSCSNIKCLQSK